MTIQRSQDEDVLRSLKNSIFGSSGLANRAEIIFLADIMRWPATAWVLLDDGLPESYQVAWINDNVLGLATVQTHTDPPFLAEVHPLSAIQSIDLAASPVAGFAGQVDLRVARSMTVRFSDGQPMTIGRLVDDQFVERFIEAVLVAVNGEEA